jgi:Raf kinase inhibitor-like YbhB/YbcL family protein
VRGCRRPYRRRPGGASGPAALAVVPGLTVAARAAALLAAALLLAACGASGGGATVPAGSQTAASTSGTQATATREQATPAATPPSPAVITVRSVAFAEDAAIPARFSCRGGNTPPPLTWTGIPPGTVSIALVMDDPDAVGGTYTHWVVVNLPATADGITGGHLPLGAAQAKNSGGQAAYLGPCPPSGTHRYRFTIYAEPRRLPLPAGAPLAEALHAIRADALTSGRLTGLFSG